MSVALLELGRADDVVVCVVQVKSLEVTVSQFENELKQNEAKMAKLNSVIAEQREELDKHAEVSALIHKLSSNQRGAASKN